MAIQEVAPPQAAGERQSDDGWFTDDSIARRVFAHAGARMFGAYREALIAAIGPEAAHAIETNSRYRTDPLGRARRTLHYGASVIYGTAAEAEKAAATVRGRHGQVRGSDPVTGRNYNLKLAEGYDAPGREHDRLLMRSGHIIIMESFMVAYDVFCKPLSRAEQDQYMREVEVLAFGHGLRPGDVPTTIDGVHAFYEEELAPQLAMTPHGLKLWQGLTDPTAFGSALWPARPAVSLILAQTLTTIPECFRRLMPAVAPRRLDPVLRRSGRLTAAALDLPPARAVLDANIHTDQANRLLAAGRAAQRRAA